MNSITEVLADIQQKLKVSKEQTNAFGKYKYRSCEDIVEAVKPLLKEHGAALVLTDELVKIGERYYIKAEAAVVLPTKEGGMSMHAIGYARETETRKGMDESQITGTASSYARKYALNGLFAIDDTKDADHESVNKEPAHRFKPGEKDAILKGVKTALEAGDEIGLRQVIDEYTDKDADPEEKMKLWALFNSTERAAIKELLK